MNWINLNTVQQLNDIREKSKTTPQVIFKHSTRCSISSMAKTRLERSAIPQGADFYYLDLISNRPLSAKVAEEFKVQHESPQVLVVMNGQCVYNESHYGIHMEDIKEQLTAQSI